MCWIESHAVMGLLRKFKVVLSHSLREDWLPGFRPEMGRWRLLTTDIQEREREEGGRHQASPFCQTSSSS